MNNLAMAFARRGGKTARFSESVARAEQEGWWVVIASTHGAHCSRCQRKAEECGGTCMTPTEETIAA